MSEFILSLVFGCAVVITAYLIGRTNAKTNHELKEMEKSYEANKQAQELRKKNNDTSDAAVREWLRNNSTKK